MNLYQKPPRSLPFIQQLCIIFGGIVQAIGWVFFCVGSLFIAVFGYTSEPIIKPNTKKWDIVQGVVRQTSATSSSENKRQIYKITSNYLYKGITYENISYKVGMPLSIGQNISIKVNPNNPSESEAEGLRTQPFSGIVVIFLSPFLIFSLFLIIPNARKNLKARNLLLFGEFTRGTLKEKRATNTTITINNVRYPVYYYIFEFEYMGKKHEAHGKTHKGWLLEDEAKEKILFNPVNPAENVIYDAIPTMPKIDPQGNATLTAQSYGNLILPAIGILLFVFFTIPILMRLLGL